MNNTCKKTLTAVLAFALAAEGMICGASFNEVSAAEQPVTATHHTNAPAALTVDAGVYEAKAGDTVKIKIKTTDIKQSYSAVAGYLNVNTDYFTVLSAAAGDTDDPDNENSAVFLNSAVSTHKSDANTEEVSFIYCNIENTDEEMVLATVELKVKDDVKDGCYELPFTLMEDDGSMANRIITNNDGFTAAVLDPEFHGALINVSGSSSETGTQEEAEESPSSENQETTPENQETETENKTPEYTYAENGQPVTATHLTNDPAALTVDAGVYEAKAGDTVKIKIKTTDIKQSYSAVAGYLNVNTDYFTVLSAAAGDTDDPNNENSAVFLNSAVSTHKSYANTEEVSFIYCNIENTDEEMVLATVELKVKDDVKDGSYELPFTLMEDDGSMANQINTKDGRFDVTVLDPEFRGAFVKISSETKPQEQTEISDKETNNEEVQNNEGIHKPGGNGPTGKHHHHHGHFSHRNRYEQTVIQQVVNDFISYIARAIFSFF